MALTNNTFYDIILLALKNAGVVGVGQTPLAQDINDACSVMNDMLAQWQQRRYLVYRLIEKNTPCNSSEFYTIGPGGDISVVQRPAAINAAFARQVVTNSNPNVIDYPLQILPSRETYSQIAMKQLQAFPQWVWYDADTPLGKLFVYPIISNQFTLYVNFREQLQTAVSLTDDITLPAEYREAIMYNLAIRLSANYGSPLNSAVPPLARAALGTIRTINAQIPRMNMPKGLVNPPRYNIFSDQAGR